LFQVILVGEQVNSGTTSKRKLEKKLKKALRKFQFLLDAKNFESDKQYPVFTQWFQQTIVQVYRTSIPSTIEYLCKSLDIAAPEPTIVVIEQVPASKKR
jgi:hypothetical protein